MPSTSTTWQRPGHRVARRPVTVSGERANAAALSRTGAGCCAGQRRGGSGPKHPKQTEKQDIQSAYLSLILSFSLDSSKAGAACRGHARSLGRREPVVTKLNCERCIVILMRAGKT
jgi:hypothetical protein